MLFKSQVLAQASGSTGGLTYSHNRGGNYTRNRKTPVNPNTSRQQAIRTALGFLSNEWVNTLTAAERDAWNTYAFNVPLIGPLGDPRNVGGLGMFQRSNVPRIQAGLTVIEVAPVIWDTGTPPALFVPTYDASAQTLSVVFSLLETWYLAGATMLVYQGRPQNATINFFKGPFRFIGTIATPDTSPQVFGPPLPYTAAADQAVFTRIRATYLDGRLTQAADFRSIVVP